MKDFQVKVAWRKGSALIQATDFVKAQDAVAAFDIVLDRAVIPADSIIRLAVLDVAEERGKGDKA